MAGGMGARYGGFKQIDPVGEYGELIIDYSVFDAVKAGFSKVVFVINENIEEPFRENFFNRISKRVNAEYVVQRTPAWREKPFGTTHALLVAKDLLTEPFCIISADDFFGFDAFKICADFIKTKMTDGAGKSTKGSPYAPSLGAAVGYRLGDTLSNHGVVNRGVIQVDKNDTVTAVHELKCLKRDGKIGRLDSADFIAFPPDTLASMLMFCLPVSVLPKIEKKFDIFLANVLNNKTSESILPSLLCELINEGDLELKCIRTTASWFGFTYPEDKPLVGAEIRALINKKLYPNPLWK